MIHAWPLLLEWASDERRIGNFGEACGYGQVAPEKLWWVGSLRVGGFVLRCLGGRVAIGVCGVRSLQLLPLLDIKHHLHGRSRKTHVNPVDTVGKLARELGILRHNLPNLPVIRLFHCNQTVAIVVVIVAVGGNVAVALLPRLAPPHCLRALVAERREAHSAAGFQGTQVGEVDLTRSAFGRSWGCLGVLRRLQHANLLELAYTRRWLAQSHCS